MSKPTRLSPEQCRAAIAEHGSQRAAARALNIPTTTFRLWAGKLDQKPADIPVVPPHAFVPSADELPEEHVEAAGVSTVQFKPGSKTKRYILTSAQNNCKVHAPFLRNLQAFAEHMGAEILISSTVYDKQGYRGITRDGGGKGEAVQRSRVWWDRAVQPYLFNQRGVLAKRLTFCGELDILATTQNPLASMDAYCSRSSIIVPHNKFTFKCVESRKGQMPKEMYTTGSVTVPRFVQRRTGQLALFHHVIGALMVEVVPDGRFWVHHLNATEDGSFYWMRTRVHRGQVSPAKRAAGLVLGDIHHEKLDEKVWEITKNEIIPSLNPADIVVHDLIDFTSRNHHNIKDPLFRVRVQHTKVQEEIHRARSWLITLMDTSAAKISIVKSNHDEALGRWIRETDWRQDPQNAAFYLRLALNMVLAAQRQQSFDPLAWSICDRLTAKAQEHLSFLAVDDSLEIKGIECGIHGHVGLSGARGTPKSYSKLGFRSFTAHTHTPSIVDGCYTVGVMGSLSMGYNRGPSKWMHTHGIIYPNGKRAFITIKDGQWHG